MEDNKSYHIELPDKLYFKIGEVASLTGLPTYVLRFWETEFRKIKPKRSPSGQRLYQKRDIELILQIKHLLYNKKFTIRGAKEYLKLKKTDHIIKSSTISIKEIREELKSIRDLLAS